MPSSSIFHRLSHGRGVDKPCDSTVVGRKFHRRRSTSFLSQHNNSSSKAPQQAEVATPVQDNNQLEFRSRSNTCDLKLNPKSPSPRSTPTSSKILEYRPLHQANGGSRFYIGNNRNQRSFSETKTKSSLKGLALHLLSSRKRSFSTTSFNSHSGCRNLEPSHLATTKAQPRIMTHQNASEPRMKAPVHEDVANNSGLREEEFNQPASVELLVRKCADSFDVEGNCINEDFPRVLFLTHLWFMTSEQLLVLFSQLYQEETNAPQMKKQVFFAIRFWLHEFPHMFDLDQALVRSLQNFQSESAGDPDVDTSMIDVRNKDSYKWMTEAHLSIRPKQLNRKRRKVSLVFNHLEPEEIAIHMSYLEYKSFRRLTLSDFHNYSVHGVIKDNLKLERVVFLFNNITHWVQCMILDHHNPQERTAAIVKFVDVAKKLYAMRNFNTLMAIVGALTHTAIARLKKTMNAVPKNTLQTLEEFVQLLDSKSNYCSYRRAYAQVTKEFKIPVIGVLMKDLIALQAALPDRVGDGLINVRKMNLIGGIFQELISLQRFDFPYDVNRDLVNTLRVSLYLYYSEEEIYQLSNAREPRDAKYSTSGTSQSPSKPINVGFGEFARYTCQLDDDTIKQHVTAMVGSVFKAYDQNSDGFISEAEFETFIQNFPGLDSFAIVDKDQDGRISMKEMVDYFLKISSTRRNELCQSFKHDFTETTYFHPTFCEDCGKLLWGLVKQGWKCKDCGINCHKHCKGRIVLECRLKTNGRNGTNLLTALKKTEKARDKLSVSSESDFSSNGDFASARRHSIVDDEAFESSSLLAKSSSAVKRSTSLAANDLVYRKSKSTSVDIHRSRLTSKTPPPDRKNSSNNLSPVGGRVFLPRKMQNMISKKRTSIKRIGQNGGFQANHNREGTVPVQSLPPRNTFHQDTNTSGEESTSLPVEDSEGEDTYSLTRELEQLKVCESGESRLTSISPLLSTHRHHSHLYNNVNHTTNFINVSDRAGERRDSGLSSCSGLTAASASTSAPTTPVSSYQNSGGTHFQYPTITSHSDSKPSSPTGTCSSGVSVLSGFNRTDTKFLLEENDRLRLDNQQLRQKLQNAQTLVSELEGKLASRGATS